MCDFSISLKLIRSSDNAELSRPDSDIAVFSNNACDLFLLFRRDRNINRVFLNRALINYYNRRKSFCRSNATCTPSCSIQFFILGVSSTVVLSFTVLVCRLRQLIAIGFFDLQANQAALR